MSDVIGAEILATKAQLGNPISIGAQGDLAFGDIELVEKLGLTSIPSYSYSRAVVDIAALPDSAGLRIGDRKAAVRHGSYAIKFCWEAPAIQEAITSEAMRIGLDRIDTDRPHGIGVPKIIAGVSSLATGILVMEFVDQHRQVDQFGDDSINRFKAARWGRIETYKDALRNVGLTETADNTDIFDDTAENTLWPTDFVPTDKKPFPDTSVRLDFGVLTRRLDSFVSWPN